MGFFKHPIFYVVALLEIAGLICFGLGDWANVVQNVSVIGMAYGFWYFVTQHSAELKHLREQLTHLHAKHDELIAKHDELHDKVDRQNGR